MLSISALRCSTIHILSFLITKQMASRHTLSISACRLAWARWACVCFRRSGLRLLNEELHLLIRCQYQFIGFIDQHDLVPILSRAHHHLRGVPTASQSLQHTHSTPIRLFALDPPARCGIVSCMVLCTREARLAEFFVFFRCSFWHSTIRFHFDNRVDQRLHFL